MGSLLMCVTNHLFPGLLHFNIILGNPHEDDKCNGTNTGFPKGEMLDTQMSHIRELEVLRGVLITPRGRYRV